MERQVYMASDVQRALGLGKTKTYEFLNEIYNMPNPPLPEKNETDDQNPIDAIVDKTDYLS